MMKLFYSSILAIILTCSANARGITEENIDDYIVLPLGHTVESPEVRGPFTLEHDLRIAFDIVKALTLRLHDRVGMSDGQITNKAMEIVASPAVCWLGLKHMPDENIRKIFIGFLADILMDGIELRGRIVMETLGRLRIFLSSSVH